MKRTTKQELLQLLGAAYHAIGTVRLDNTRTQRVCSERPDSEYWKGMASQAVCIEHKLADDLRDTEVRIREVLGYGGELTKGVKLTLNEMARECGQDVPYPEVETSK